MNSTGITPNYLKSLEVDTLLDISNAINRQIDEDSLLKIFLFTVVANFKISKLLVYSRELTGWDAVLKHNCNENDFIQNETLQFLAKKFDFVYFQENDSYQNTFSKFDVFIPVGRENRNIGMIFISGLRKIDENQQLESLKFIQTIANIITVAIQNNRLNKRKLEQQSIKKEIELTRKLQSKLIPSNLPLTNKLKIFANYIPHYKVGGDYFDYLTVNENEFYLCIADVSGKGLVAAMIMSNLQAALRVLVKLKCELSQIITELNSLIYQNTKGEKFVTLFLAHFNLQEKKIRYVNCGHNEPIFFEQGKDFRMLNEGSLILGAFENLPIIKIGEIENISDKALLFAYTDGLVEAFDQNDTDEAIKIIKQCITENNTEWKLNAEILEKMNIKNASFDDITVLSCFI